MIKLAGESSGRITSRIARVLRENFQISSAENLAFQGRSCNRGGGKVTSAGRMFRIVSRDGRCTAGNVIKTAPLGLRCTSKFPPYGGSNGRYYLRPKLNLEYS